MKFSDDAMLAAAAAIVAARIQARGESSAETDASEMLVRAMTEVLAGIDLMEDEAKTENMDLWSRLSG